MATTSNHYILILCGGTGPRLWPLSRANLPKQFLRLFGKNSLLQDTIIRYKKFIPKENIYIISNEKYLPELKKQVNSHLPLKNIITEPDKKNTALAILYGTAVIQSKNPQAIITASPADHFIGLPEIFKKEIKQSANIAQTTNSIVAFGIKPVYANPSFGYLLPSNTTGKFHPVVKFIEKPSAMDALIYINKGAYWNSGIYTFSIQSLITEFSLYHQDYYQIYLELTESLKKPNLIKKLYKLSPNLPIDKAISEKTKKLVFIPVSFKWSDIGEWKAIFEQLKKDSNLNALLQNSGPYVSINSKGCLVSTAKNKLVGLVGVSGLAIIDSPTGLLVCDLKDCFSVRDLVGKIVSDPQLKKFFLQND